MNYKWISSFIVFHVEYSYSISHSGLFYVLLCQNYYSEYFVHLRVVNSKLSATTQTIYSPSLMDRPIQDDFMLNLKINTLMDVEMFDLKNGGINEDKCNS